MSLTEITAAIDELPAEERACVAAHLRRRFCEDTPERRSELDEIMREMDAGKKFTLGQLRQQDEALRAQGR